MFIVTANFLDRYSQYKWLVRRMGEPLSAARAFGAVIARNILITVAAEERDFGCVIVAVCDDVVCYDMDSKPLVLGEADRLQQHLNAVAETATHSYLTDKSIEPLPADETARPSLMVDAASDPAVVQPIIPGSRLRFTQDRLTDMQGIERSRLKTLHLANNGAVHATW